MRSSENGFMQVLRAATLAPSSRVRSGMRLQDERFGPAARALAATGIAALLAALAVLAADAASSPSRYVPADSGGWPGWLAGPLSGLGSHLGSSGFQALMLVVCGGYALALLGARAVPLRWLAAAVVAAHVILVLGPPLLSQDVFGYVAFARMGALHGLDPYTHFPSEAIGDPVFGFIGWPFQHSPYGPLFTLASYATAPLGLAGALWSLKVATALFSLAAVALTARAAERRGLSPSFAVAFLGLNPVLLVLAVGGAHNDTMLIAALALALMLSAGASAPRWLGSPSAGHLDGGPPRRDADSAGAGLRGAALALAGGVGVKLTAGLLLPFLALAPREPRRRGEVALTAVLGLVGVAAIGLIGFGPHALGFLTAIGEQQQLVATHSVPAETARLIGLHGTPGWWRHVWVGLFLLALAAGLWRTARGADWRAMGGWATLALLLSTAWLLPWYAVWPLPLAAVSGDRRLRAAVLLLCVYAVLIHLPLADPLLSPGHPGGGHLPPGIGSPLLRDRVEFTGLEVLGDVSRDLRW
jgi:hypothetical protein